MSEGEGDADYDMMIVKEENILTDDLIKKNHKKVDSGTSSGEDDEDFDEEDEKRTPKEVLLAEMKKLGDIFGKYSLTDRYFYLIVQLFLYREMFLSDFESILKILSYE